MTVKSQSQTVDLFSASLVFGVLVADGVRETVPGGRTSNGESP